jgi:Xaa-Pro aminopeptidase
MIRHAAEISAAAYADVLRTTWAGRNEFALQETIEHGYRSRGSRGPAYGSIVGSGINSTVLHYRANDRDIEDGDVICIDSGARWGGYGADVTRTIPANGRFTERQRELYDIVLAALEAGIAASRPGVTLKEIDAAARKVIADAGYGDAFIHSIGHHLGLETHDTCGQGPLAAGAVITIEPGIYLPAERIGIRIEDDIVIRDGEAENLTAHIPRTAEAIEAAMAGG